MSQTQTYNDGLVTIYALENIAQAGDKPAMRLCRKAGPFRYAERLVGMSRFWSGMRSKARIDMVVRTQRIEGISTQDIAIKHNGEQYKIMQKQYPPDVSPPSMDLSLERTESDYDFA